MEEIRRLLRGYASFSFTSPHITERGWSRLPSLADSVSFPPHFVAFYPLPTTVHAVFAYTPAMPVATTDVDKHLETLGLKSEDLNEDAVRGAYKKLVSPFCHRSRPQHGIHTIARLSCGILIATMRIQRRLTRSSSRYAR